MQIWEKPKQIPQLFCDNQSAIALTLNFKSHARTKHIEIYYHFVRKKISYKDVMLQYYPTKEMITDVFIKKMPKVKHHWCRATTIVEKNLNLSL
jgi:hypothetical protein